MANASSLNATATLIFAGALRAEIVENPLQVSWFYI